MKNVKRGRVKPTGVVVSLSAGMAALMIAQQVASKAVRDGVFLSAYDISALPIATLAGAAFSLAAALLLSRFIATFTPAGAVPVLFAANGGLFLTEAALMPHAPRGVAALLYMHVAAFGGAVVSGFWSVINERFDPYTAKQVMGRIAGGATFGGVIGGVVTWAFSDVAPRWLLTGFGLTSIVCAVTIAHIAQGATGAKRGEERATSSLLAGVEVLAREPYPRALAAIVFLVALGSDTVDYVFKAAAAGADHQGSLVGFFAVYYTATGISTFVLQAVASQRALKRLGVTSTVAVFPVVLLLLLLPAVLYPSLALLVLLRGGAMVIENSLYRSGYELLYTPVPPEQKRSAKVIVDLGFDRLGTAAASGVALIVIAAGHLDVGRTMLLTAGMAMLGLLIVVVRVRRQYVASLASQLAVSEVPSSTGENDLRALASTFVAAPLMADTPSWHDASTPKSISRQVLRERVSERAAQKAKRRAPSAPAPLPRSEVAEELLDTPLRAALREGQSLARLQTSAPALAGQLGDLFISRRETTAVRLRAAEMLARVPSGRAAAALVDGLQDPSLRVRRAAALGLLMLVRIAPALRPPRPQLVEVAVRELERTERPDGLRTSFERSSPFMLDARGREIAPSLEVVFLLLAIAGDEQQIRLALQAVTSGDDVRRGTGLELLDSLLPGNLRQRLLALVEQPELTAARRDLPAEVVARLAADLRDGSIDLAGLRKRFRAARRHHYEKPS